MTNKPNIEITKLSSGVLWVENKLSKEEQQILHVIDGCKKHGLYPCPHNCFGEIYSKNGAMSHGDKYDV